MKAFIYYFFCFTMVSFVLFLATGCKTTQGDRRVSDTSIVQEIRPGVSNMDDVRLLIGEPNNVSFSGTNQVWHYSYAEATIRGSTFIPIAGFFLGGVDNKEDNVNILFDENEIVKNVVRGQNRGGNPLYQ